MITNRTRDGEFNGSYNMYSPFPPTLNITNTSIVLSPNGINEQQAHLSSRSSHFV